MKPLNGLVLLNTQRKQTREYRVLISTALVREKRAMKIQVRDSIEFQKETKGLLHLLLLLEGFFS